MRRIRVYDVEAVEGYQAVNGRVVENVIYADAQRCLVCDPHDSQEMAERAFAAGRIAERYEQHREPPEFPTEFIDDAAVVFEPHPDFDPDHG